MDQTIVAKISDLDLEEEKHPCLTFIKGPRLGEIVQLTQDQTVVGRSKDANLSIEDTTISRRHFEICKEGAGHVLKDLGSTNGTYLNGQRIQTAILADGDRIQISQETFFEFSYLEESRRLTDQKLYEMGVIDAVTQVHNRRYWTDRLKEEFANAKRSQTPLSLAMIDIDHFKSFNDNHGHLAGDACLFQVAQALAKSVRANDVFGRYGGEEFGLIMRNATLAQGVDAADRHRRTIESLKIQVDGKELSVTVSMGVAQVSDDMQTFEDLIKKADSGLYQSKSAGRNRVTGC